MLLLFDVAELPAALRLDAGRGGARAAGLRDPLLQAREEGPGNIIIIISYSSSSSSSSSSMCMIMIIIIMMFITSSHYYDMAYDSTCILEMGGAPKNPAPRNHPSVRIVKSPGCRRTDAFGREECRRVPTPLRSTSPFSGVLQVLTRDARAFLPQRSSSCATCIILCYVRL